MQLFPLFLGLGLFCSMVSSSTTTTTSADETKELLRRLLKELKDTGDGGDEAPSGNVDLGTPVIQTGTEGSEKKELSYQDDEVELKELEILDQLKERFGEDNEVVERLEEELFTGDDEEAEDDVELSARGTTCAQYGAPGVSDPRNIQVAYYLKDGRKIERSFKWVSEFAHNRFRSKHLQTGTVRWDAALGCQAQKWADHLLRTKQMVHDYNTHAGENLFHSYNTVGGVPGPEFATYAWYHEIKDYSWASGGSFSSSTGHFTQVVWRKSSKIGCGRASTVQNYVGMLEAETVIVCRYTLPQGDGSFGENVKPLKTGNSVAKVLDIAMSALVPRLAPRKCFDYNPICAANEEHCHKGRGVEYFCHLTCEPSCQ